MRYAWSLRRTSTWSCRHLAQYLFGLYDTAVGCSFDTTMPSSSARRRIFAYMVVSVENRSLDLENKLSLLIPTTMHPEQVARAVVRRHLAWSH